MSDPGVNLLSWWMFFFLRDVGPEQHACSTPVLIRAQEIPNSIFQLHTRQRRKLHPTDKIK